MKTTNDQTLRDVEEVTGSLVQNLRLDQSMCLDTEVEVSPFALKSIDTYNSSGIDSSKSLGNGNGNGIPDTSATFKQDITLSNDKRRASIASSGEGSNRSNGSSSIGNSNTSQTANVVTNTNSSSGDDRFNDKSGSCSNTCTGERGETTKVSAQTKEHLDQNSHSLRNLHHRRAPTHNASPVPQHVQHDVHAQQRYHDGGFDSYKMEITEHVSTAYAPMTSKLPKRKRTKSKNGKPFSELWQDISDHESRNSSDSGYDASGSSNDVSGISSPSASSSDSSGTLSRSKVVKRKDKAYWAQADHSSFKQDSSSDLADFSSGVSSDSSPRISPGPLSDDSEEITGKNAPVVYFNSAVKPTVDFGSIPFAPAASETSGTVLSTYPVRHRRRYSAPNTIRENSTHLKSFQVSKNTNGDDNTDAQNDTTVPPTYSLPDTWSFVERQLKRKMKFEDILKKKTYEEHYKELNANFVSAVKRVRYLDSGSSMSSSSVKSSLSATSYVEGCQTQASVPVAAAAPAASFDVGTETPIYDVGADVMAKILTYLKPTEVYSVVSMPLSKTFKSTFSNTQDLWKVLCLSAPFYAKVDKSRENSDDSIKSYPLCKNKDADTKHLLGRYRLLYSSFIQCIRYLDRIKEDAKNGRKPAGIYVNEEQSQFSYEENDSLTNFFATAHQLKRKERNDSDDSRSSGARSSQKRRKAANEHKKVRHFIIVFIIVNICPCLS